DGLVCINPDYEARNKDRYRTALIPNGTDLERFHSGADERQHFGFAPDRPIILMVSALIASKNVDEGVRAVAKLKNADLVVAGDGPLREEIKRLADEIMPGRYRQITVSSGEMPSLYRSADAFLHLSRDESFGNVYVEALATGLPIVAYDLPRTRWILGDEAFYAGNDTSDVAARLSEALASAGGVESRVKRAQRYAWPAIAMQYRAFFNEVLTNGHR
ncbi:MAG TPA: glycosyltransferase family 4 protein, partial [Sphingomicrobium sp.]|nr:glycosyltransferase family 4 protein [Sphingomicrobium sp.]